MNARSPVRGFAAFRGSRGFAAFAGSPFRGFAAFAASRLHGFAGFMRSRRSQVRGFAAFGGSRIRGFADRMLSEHELNYMVCAWMLGSAYALPTRTELWFGHGRSDHRMFWEHEQKYGLCMVLWSAYALGTQTEVWFGHGCSGRRMLSEHEQTYGSGMDALVSACSRITNGIMVSARMLWSGYVLPTRTELCLGHRCLGHRVLSDYERNYGLGTDALVRVCSSNTNGIMVWAWMLWSAHALGTRTEFWFAHGCSGHRMRLEQEQICGLGMDALISVCSSVTNGIMVWAWMLSGQRMLLQHGRNYGLGMDALVTVCFWNTNRLMVRAWMLWSAHALGSRTE